MREFGTSIYSRPRARQRPTYHKVTWLHVLRAERRRDAQQAALDKIMADTLVHGIGIAHVNTLTEFFRKPKR